MSEELEKELKEMREDIKIIKQYIPLMDVVSNRECAEKLGIPWETFRYWMREDGFPRQSSRKCSVSQVQKWRSETVTKKKP